MSQWSKSAYQGPTQEGWEEGRGKFTYPNGVQYDGNFKKGEFHGEGTLIQTNGVSTFRFYPNRLLINRVDTLANGKMEN